MKGVYIKNCRVLLFGLLMVFFGAAAGCGDGGNSSSSTSSTAGSALSVAEKVSVVDSQNASSSSIQGLRIGDLLPAAATDLPADSAYNTDTVFVYVNEPSAEALGMINEILCMMAQSQYDAMVNQDAYKAQIDLTQCERGGDSATGAAQGSMNQSSGNGAPEYEFWTVESSRADSTSPHIVKAWIHQEGEGFEPAGIIEVNVTITEAASTSNPYGIFTMMFKQYAEASPDTTMFKGYLKTEQATSSDPVLVKFYMGGSFDSPGGSITFNEGVTLSRGSDGSSGAGTISKSDVFDGTADSSAYNIAYNSTHFLREDQDSNQVCLARANPDVTAMRYALYHDENSATPGAQLEINSGFPIQVTSSGTVYNGWVGFWGVWLPGGLTLSDGDSVTKQSFNGAATATYNLVIKPGKLKKYTKVALSLSDIQGLPFDFMDPSDNGTYRVKWNGSAFVKFQTRDETNWVWKNIDEAALSLTALNWNVLSFWSQSLGGEVRIELQNCTDNGGNPSTFDCTSFTQTGNIVTLFSETTITPASTGVPSTLLCLSNCPDPSAFTNVNDGGNPYFSTSDWQNTAPASATYQEYAFSTSTMLLTNGGTNVVLSDSVSSGAYQWGVMSGPLFEDTAANKTALACEWDSNQTCGWNAWMGLSEFYVWETGPSSWNQLSLLQNPSDGTYLTFDPPKQVTYTHTQTDTSASDYKYNGTKFYLDYNGYGDLFGIPGKCVDMDTGSDVDCFDLAEDSNKHIRWVNEFNISDGSTVTSSGTTYYVKAVEKEERMNSTTVSDCTDAGLTLTTYDLPDETLWTDPNNGTEPDVTASAPAVIGGVVQ